MHFTNAESLENFWRRQDLRVASGPSSVGGVRALTAPSAISELLCLLIFAVRSASVALASSVFGSFSSNWARWISVEARQWVKSLRWNTDYHHLLVLRVFSSQEGTRTYKVAGRQLESLQFLETQVTWGDAKDDLSPAISVISVWCAWALSHHSVRQTYSGQRVRWSNISNSEGWSNHSSACSVIWFFLLFTHLKCSEHAGMEVRGDLRKKSFYLRTSVCTSPTETLLGNQINTLLVSRYSMCHAHQGY